MGIAFIVAVSISNQVFRGWKIDLTENNLYTLSDGTRNLLAGIEEPEGNERVWVMRDSLLG